MRHNIFISTPVFIAKALKFDTIKGKSYFKMFMYKS